MSPRLEGLPFCMCADGFSKSYLIAVVFNFKLFLLASDNSKKLLTILKILQKPGPKRGPKSSYVDTENTYKKPAMTQKKHLAFWRIFPASNKF
jgi:hypothetical protein